jgi:hypothetical protein
MKKTFLAIVFASLVVGGLTSCSTSRKGCPTTNPRYFFRA